MFYRKKGFTLLELMIVVIIIGILATLALPRFLKAASKARWAGAASTLGIIRNAQMRYYAEYSEFTDDMTNLDIGMDDTAEWDIQNPAGTPEEVGKVLHIPSPTGKDEYTISSAGIITPTDPY